MTEIITNNDAHYAFDIVKAICTEVGPGLPGSPQERERAAVIKKELESHLGAENVVVEEFTVAPGAFLGSLPISALFTLIAALLNISMGRFTGISPWLTVITALAFSILSVLLVIFEFTLGFEFVDPFFKKKQSVNMIGTLRKPGTKNVKRLLILSGHHDSAWENTWLRFLGYGFLIGSATWFIGLITMLGMSIIQLMGMITGNADIVRIGTLGWVLLAYPIVPSIIFAMFFNMGRKNGGTVPGAADNLSASAVAVALCRFLVKNPSYIPADTEIRFISFGSEEAGVRGSRRYVERHLDELKRLDARLLNFEMIAHPEIVILASDVNGTMKNSPEMVRSVVAAAERAGVPYKVQSTFFGGPGSAAILLGGKLLYGLMVSLAQILVLFLVASTMFKLDLGNDPLAFTLVCVALATTVACLGMLASAIKFPGSAITAPLVIGALLGGCLFSPDFMPPLLRTISYFIPHTWAMTAYQDLLVRGQGLAQVLPEIGVLLLFAAIFFGVGVWRFDPLD